MIKPFDTKTQIFTDWLNFPSDDEVSVDIETTALDPFDGKIRLVQCYFPSIDQVAVIDLWELTGQKQKFLNTLVTRLSNPTIKKYMQNGYFDCSWFRVHYGILIKNVCDSRLLSQVDKAGLFDAFLFQAKIQSPNGLEYLSKEYGADHDKTEQSSDWGGKLTQSQKDYAAKDAYYTYWIAKELEKELTDQTTVVDAENGSLPCFVEMWYRGLPANYNNLLTLAKSYENASQKAKQALSTLMTNDPCQAQKILDYARSPTLGTKGQPIKQPKPKEFNVASPSQVKAWLIREFGQQAVEKYDSKTRTVKESTGKDVLFSIYTDHPERRDVLDVINFRGVSKAASTLKSYIESYDPKRRCMKTAYSVLASQGMGRSSSGDRSRKDVQNVQNISKYLASHKAFNLLPIRSFVQAKDGYTLLEIDLSASHAQFARHLSNDSSLQEAKQEGLKLHYYTMSAMLKFSGIDVTPRECIPLSKGEYATVYKLSKTVFYSFLNYAGANTLQQTFFKNDIFVSLQECKNYLNACATRFSGLRRFQNKVFRDANNRVTAKYTKDGKLLGRFGYSKTCDGGLIWHQVPSYSNDLKISDVVSCHWLRPEATVMKRSLARILEVATNYGLDSVKLCNFSHDSVLLECKNDLVARVLPNCWEIINQEMRVYVPDYESDDPMESCILKENWTK